MVLENKNQLGLNCACFHLVEAGFSGRQGEVSRKKDDFEDFPVRIMPGLHNPPKKNDMKVTGSATKTLKRERWDVVRSGDIMALRFPGPCMILLCLGCGGGPFGDFFLKVSLCLAFGVWGLASRVCSEEGEEEEAVEQQ